MDIYDKDGNKLSINEVVSRLPELFVLKDTNRVEVIDSNGRSYTNMGRDNVVEISLQDNQRTLKIFITKK